MDHSLSYVLQHRVFKLNLNIQSDGYMVVKYFLNLNMIIHVVAPLHSHTFDDMREVVKKTNKQMYWITIRKWCAPN